jgi:hypothetical protein
MSRKALETPPAFAALVAYPTLVTMALAGIWHGAGLQFLVFGLLHGAYLTINHGWRMFRRKKAKSETPARPGGVGVIAGEVLLTYIAVLVADVFFRASSCKEAVHLLAGMVGLHGLSPINVSDAQTTSHGLARPLMQGLHHVGIDATMLPTLGKIIGLFIVVWFLPNSQQIMARANPILPPLPAPAPQIVQWNHSLIWALLMGALAFLAIMSLGGTTEFLYFQF